MILILLFYYFNLIYELNFKLIKFVINYEMRIGDWGLGIGPNPQSPIPNPQSPIPNPHIKYIIIYILTKLY